MKKVEILSDMISETRQTLIDLKRTLDPSEMILDQATDALFNAICTIENILESTDSYKEVANKTEDEA